MRREIVVKFREQLHSRTDWCTGECRECDAEAEYLLRSVLRALLAGETDGQWRVERVNEWTWGVRCSASPDGMVVFASTGREEALAVANALNLSRDLAAGGNDGE